jgi:hypothetical protein
MRITGMHRLVTERAANIVSERASVSGKADGNRFEIHVDLSALELDLRGAAGWAQKAVAAVRSAPDFDPAVHGQTDDEVADFILNSDSTVLSGHKDTASPVGSAV